MRLFCLMLNASQMHQLWVVSKEDGMEMYGDNYIDIWTMNKLHHLSGSGYTCDHVRLFNVRYILHCVGLPILEAAVRI